MGVFVGLLGLVAVIYTVSADPEFSGDPYCPGYWTKYYDRDNPSGNGDYETLKDLRKRYPEICPYPVEIDVRLLDGYSWKAGGNYILPEHRSPSYGFTCVNKYQKKYYKPPCKDYKIRFCCLPKEPKCPGYWSPYYNNDSPGGTGDWEDLHVKKYPVCKYPYAAWAKLADGRHYLAGGDKVHLSKNGLVCKNKEQKDYKCHDYKVKFCCPKVPVCYWTDWFDVDDPSGKGDYETIENLRKKYKFCKYPKKIEAVDTKTYKDAHYTGQVITYYDTKHGFVCENYKQGFYKHSYKYKQCYDYKVRLYCCH